MQVSGVFVLRCGGARGNGLPSAPFAAALSPAALAYELPPRCVLEQQWRGPAQALDNAPFALSHSVDIVASVLHDGH